MGSTTCLKVTLADHCCLLGGLSEKARLPDTFAPQSPMRRDESARVALSCELVGCFPSGKEQARAGSRGGGEPQPIGGEAGYSPNEWAGGKAAEVRQGPLPHTHRLLPQVHSSDLASGHQV